MFLSHTERVVFPRSLEADMRTFGGGGAFLESFVGFVTGEEMQLLCDYAAAAARLSTTERHIRELRARREIPFVKIGGSVRFKVADLDAYVEARTVPAQ